MSASYPYKIHSRIHRRRKLFIKKVLTALFLLIFLLGLNVLGPDHSADAHEDKCPGKQIYYTSIEVTSGDTLWDIAEEYSDMAYGSVYDYIREVKTINGLTSNNIQDGQYLTIPYYAL